MIFFMSNISTRVTVTGANGFVGKNLRNFLYKNKINVLGVSRKNFRKHASEVKIISTNLLEPKLQTKLKNYDALVHLIGIGRQSPKSTFEEINLNLTKNVIKACKNAGIKKIIFISGLGVSKNNQSDYFVSKYKAEREIMKSGLDYTIFRASYIIGKTDYLTKALYKQMKKGIIVIPGSGKYRLQPIFVLDVAKIILEAVLEKKFSKKILDLAGPQKIRFEDFVKLFAKNTSVKIQKISLESAYDEAKRNPRSVYGLESLNILVGDYTSDGKQLKKLSNVKLTTVAEFLQSSRLS
uniref:NAD dependent epimerase/dehydratase family protein n=2 Tax=environmental samples TaxID=651140 RepID=A0A075HQZ3_9ARCH|nr:NAD dependent epimerase/dehydratase family protein [uncultured marine thaumarchaeote KM3_154_A05]AIF17890.1 NAD dependent epimerase/dehydratase family protein [uncultured marine thaumarchaeote KM3_79_E03]